MAQSDIFTTKSKLSKEFLKPSGPIHGLGVGDPSRGVIRVSVAKIADLVQDQDLYRRLNDQARPYKIELVEEGAPRTLGVDDK